MSSYADLIKALQVLKNVKEKRHGIKTLASLCNSVQYQLRITQAGGWKQAILPLIISLDEECRKYAALAIANLSYEQRTHEILLKEDVLKHLVPILYSEECPEVVIYVLNCIGNLSSSSVMWTEMHDMRTAEAVVKVLTLTTREEARLQCLFCLSNMTEDRYARAWMMENRAYEVVWGLLQHASYTMREFAVATLRGLSVEESAQEIFPKIGMLPIIIEIFSTQQTLNMRSLAVDILYHISFLKANHHDLMHPSMMNVILDLAGDAFIVANVRAVGIIANLCESLDLHDRIVESELFQVLSSRVLDEGVYICGHVYRAMMLLSLSPRYHHVILATGAVANACPIAMMDRLPAETRCNVLLMMGAICATHPATTTSNDILDLLHLICEDHGNLEMRRGAALVLANCSAEESNKDKILQKPFVEALVLALSKATDTVLTDYLMQFFHNISKMDYKTGSMLVQGGYHKHMFTFERLESLTIPSIVYLADTLRCIVADTVVRGLLMEEQIFVTMSDAWNTILEDPRVMPHIALMCSAVAYHSDAHEEFVLQGGVRVIIQMYSDSTVEHVRLCCILTLLYLAESHHSQMAIVQERGVRMLLHACENESNIDLITNSLKALIPFASSDTFRPQLGLDGAIDTCAAFVFSEQPGLQQLGVYLLQQLLELKENRRIFLGLAEEKKCEEDYLEPLARFLPTVSNAPPPRKAKRISEVAKTSRKKAKPGEAKKGADVSLSAHDPFIVRTAIHTFALLSLEHNAEVHRRFIDLQLPQALYNLFYSGRIDRSAGEAIVLFFANCMHGDLVAQSGIMRGIDVISLLLCCGEMGFSSHTNARCLSAVLAIARQPDFRRMVLEEVDLIMVSLNANLNGESRDEDFYATAALHCALLCELTRTPPDAHGRLVSVSVIEAFLVFITVAGRGLRDEICIELLVGAVFGISTLLASPTCGLQFMKSMLHPAPRLQLFLSLLRLPKDDIDSTFHIGTFGLRMLQRTIFPNVRTNELYIDHLDKDEFLGMCQIRPSDFIYRHVVRCMCLLLADAETRGAVLQAISVQSIVPTCLFALNGATDIFVEIFGYMLISSFCYEPSLVPTFVANASIVNEVLNCCRRAGLYAAGAEGDEPAVADQMSRLLKGNPMWSARQVALKRLMLSMVTLTNIAEPAKERYGVSVHGDGETAHSNEIRTPNKVFLKRLSAICFEDFNCEELLNAGRMTEVQEYMSLLRLMTLHNSLLVSIEREHVSKGGLVADLDWQAERVRRPISAMLVIPELRSKFKTIASVQKKTDQLIKLVDKFIEIDASRNLVRCILEALSGMTYCSPLSVSSPYKVYSLINRCPEWLQPNLCLLLANTLADGVFCDPEVDDWLDKESMLDSVSDHLFPLLSTCSLETRNYTLGFLANLAAQPEFTDFVTGSGVFRILKPLPSRAYFTKHFALMIEATRMLSNMSNFPETHMTIATENVIGFLRDVLRHVAALLHGGVNHDGDQTQQAVYTRVDVEFEQEDKPPLGLRIRWVQPAEIIEVLPDTPAARLTESLQRGDELMEVNGVDVSELDEPAISSMLKTRPLHLLFRRRVEANGKDKTRFIAQSMDSDMTQKAEEPESAAGFEGSPEEYLECFHLGLLIVHNIAMSHETHAILLAESKILNLLMELLASEITRPSLRRLIFSVLTTFALHKDIGGPIFYQMADYFMHCEHADSSLQKYIMLCANLFYTSMSSDEIKPDRSMLVFVGRLSDQGEGDAAQAVAEILHGMARAPTEALGPFVCRETLVLTQEFMEFAHIYEVQLRAFESTYFMTMNCCDPLIWTALEILPRMVKAAGEAHRRGEKEGGDVETRADALFEITMRTLDMSMCHEGFQKYVSNMPDLDRYLMDLLCSKEKPPHMAHCATHLMACLLKSSIGSNCWARWKALGIVARILTWFHGFGALMRGGSEAATLPRGEGKGKQRGDGGEDFDQMMNMLVFALEKDQSFVSDLSTPDVIFAISTRILNIVVTYQENSMRDTADWSQVEKVRNADISFCTIAQILTALTASAKGLETLGKLELEGPLVSLLLLPPGSFRIPTLLMLCTAASEKSSCVKMMRSTEFQKVIMEDVNTALASLGFPWDELEYFVCVIDRCFCHTDVCALKAREYMPLLWLMLSKAITGNAQLLALRAILACTAAEPELLDAMPSHGVSALHYIMAMCSCLQVEGGQPKTAQSKAMMRNNVLEMQVLSPDKGRIAAHFARMLLAEAVSVSRPVCVSVFADLDTMGMLDKVAAAFAAAPERIDVQMEDRNKVCAELLNELASLLNTVLNCTFRQGETGGAEDTLFEGDEKKSGRAKDHALVLVRVLDGLNYFLQLKVDGHTQFDTKQSIALILCADIRVLYYVTALLHELCAKDLRSAFLAVVRTEVFCSTVGCTLRLALRRFRQEVHGPPPKDLCTNRQGALAKPSPFVGLLGGYCLAHVFEHLLVCLRHLLLQAMYVPATAAESLGAPWAWQGQWAAQLHREALSWLPDVVNRYAPTHPGLKVELVRYVCAVATFREAPSALSAGDPGQPPLPRSLAPALDLALEGEDDTASGAEAPADELDHDSEPPDTAEPLRVLLRVFSVVEPEAHGILVDAMEKSEDQCVRCLAVLATSNFVEYERRHVKETATPLDAAGTERLCSLVPVVCRMMEGVDDFHLEVGISCMENAMRFFTTCLAFGSQELAVTIYTSGVWEIANLLFERFFHDETRVVNVRQYVSALLDFMTFVRNWICNACLMEQHLTEQRNAASATISEEEDALIQTRLDVVGKALEVTRLLNFLVAVALKLTDTDRELPDPNEMKDSLFNDMLSSYQTVFYRQEPHGKVHWSKLNAIKFEHLLEMVHIHRQWRSGERDDTTMVNTLYSITKLAYVYTRQHFPDYLMDIAYGPRESWCTLQDVAAICSAIIFTQNAAEGGGISVNMGDVIKDYGAFIKTVSEVPDPKMQLWHFRTITQWCMRPRVVDDISKNPKAVAFIVGATLGEFMGRYSVIFSHNISVLRCQCLVTQAGALKTFCEAYRRLPPGSACQGGESERRMLRRLLLSSIRNCTYGVKDLDASIHDEDLQAIATLVAEVEEPDLPIYLAGLRNICRDVRHERVSAVFPQHGPLLELCARELLARSASMGETGMTHPDEMDLYDLELLEEEDDADDHSTAPTIQKIRDQAKPKLKGLARLAAQQKEKKGLGKRVGLYKKKRIQAAMRTTGEGWSIGASAPTASAAIGGGEQEEEEDDDHEDEGEASRERRMGLSSRSPEVIAALEAETEAARQEYIYVSAIEILTHTTFAEDRAEIVDAVDAAFEKHSPSIWLETVKRKVELHKSGALTLTDTFVCMSAKLIWHGWANVVFRPHFEAKGRVSDVADMIPFFLEWPNEDVRHLAQEICRYAKLHQYQVVCDYFVKTYRKYPEMAATLLSSCLADEESTLQPYQAAQFVGVFVEMLRSRSLSRANLKRVVVSIERGLVGEHPAGFSAYMMQSEHDLLSSLLEQLMAYCEEAYVRQAMAVTLVQTVGRHYKALPALDAFVVRVLQLAPSLLEGDFTFFLPVLQRLCVVGGKRVQAPFLERQLHLRILRILEAEVVVLEKELRDKRAAAAGIISGGQPEAVRDPSDLGPRQKMQWCMALFADLASNDLHAREQGSIGHVQNVEFDTFVCVDLLPVLMRILKCEPEGLETSSVYFLLSAMSHSPCIAPHVADILHVSEYTILPRIEQPRVDHDAATRDRGAKEAADGTLWQPVQLPDPERFALGMRRSFLHLLGVAGHLPKGNAGALSSLACFEFVCKQGLDPTFDDMSAPLHVKLLVLARLCERDADYGELQNFSIFDILRKAEAQLIKETTTQPRDLRIVWIHAIVSFVKLQGLTFLKVPKCVQLWEDAFDMAEEIMHDSLELKVAQGLSLTIQCEQALGAAMVPLVRQKAFNITLRAKYTSYLLSIISSGPLESLRVSACDQLAEMVSKGHDADVCGAILIGSPCDDAFKHMIRGSSEPLAKACTKLLMEFVTCAGFRVHLHLLGCLEAVVDMMGNISSSQARIVALADLFVAMTTTHVPEIIEGVIEQKAMPAFLSLGRSNQASRREIVGKWLEAYGASLSDIDDIIEAFSISSLRGLLYIAARCTLERDAAQELRRIIFGLIKRRVDTCRKSVAGVAEFLTEPLINALVPVCELQPDLVAAIVALFHELQTQGEVGILERVWAGGHLPWLCRRLSHKSSAQMEAVTAAGLDAAPVGPHWERHDDLVCTQGMALRILWNMYDLHPVDFVGGAIGKECFTKHWREYLTYYFQLMWPMKDVDAVEESTEAAILLATQMALRLTSDANTDQKLKLILQGMLNITFAVLLPNPQDRKEQRKEMQERPPAAGEAEAREPEAVLVPEAKLMAGNVTARLMAVGEAFRWVADRRQAATPEQMCSQLYHWRARLLAQQGDLNDLATVTLMERQATLYFSLLYVIHVEHGLKYIGIGCMAAIAGVSLEVWARHNNPLMRHYALRTLSGLWQVQPIYAYIMAKAHTAELVEAAVHQTLSSFDVRSLRRVLHLFVASLAFALEMATMTEYTRGSVASALRTPDGLELAELMRSGAAAKANLAAERHLLRPAFLRQLINWCEFPDGDMSATGDPYGRVWALWLVLAMLRRKQPANRAGLGETTGGVLEFHKADAKTLERRRQSTGETQVDDKEALCVVNWLLEDSDLGLVLAKMVKECMVSLWTEARMIGCMAGARLFYELPHFLQAATFTLEGRSAIRCVSAPEKSLQLCALLTIAAVSSYQLPAQAEGNGDEFLKDFFALQKAVIEGIASAGEGPYDLLARRLHMPPGALPCEAVFRGLVSFNLGQCVVPPLARCARATDLEPPRTLASVESEALPVAKCPTPSPAFLDALAAEILREDQRLRKALAPDKNDIPAGPLHSPLLCHALYALAAIVPLHAKAAAASSLVRGAAFAQLMKVQAMAATGNEIATMLDPADGTRERAKLMLYLRSAACIRSALRCISSSWLAPDAGPLRVSLSGEGGLEFVAFCAKHLNQAYSSKSGSKFIGVPYERTVLKEGPTSTIGDLLLRACSTEGNLSVIGKLGGQQALLGLSRYGETTAVRKQATLYLTKLAVLSA